MQIILEANGLWEMIEPNEKTEADNKKGKTAIAFLYQALPKEQLLQITKYKTVKSIWEALKTRHLGEERVQQARLQTLKSDFEMLQIKEDETIDAFTKKLTTLVNKASSLGHIMEDETLVRKLLNDVPDRYLQIVASIEQYSDLSEMTLEEAIGRLKTYEERIKYKGKQVDNQDRLLFTRYEEQGIRRGHGGSNQSRGQENNFKKETHNNSNKLTHDKSKEWKKIPFNIDLTDIKQQGVSSESLDGGITESMNQPGINEDIHCKNSKLEGGNTQKYDQPGLKEDHNNKDDESVLREACQAGCVESVTIVCQAAVYGLPEFIAILDHQSKWTIIIAVIVLIIPVTLICGKVNFERSDLCLTVLGTILNVLVVACLVWLRYVNGVTENISTTKYVKLSGLPTASGLFGYCFAGHPYLPILYRSIMINENKMRIYTSISFFPSLLTYVYAAILGYSMFGANVKSVYILNMPLQYHASLVAVIAM
nr:zinc finger, CCHC-type [Tanacetum cinerariifolium]